MRRLNDLKSLGDAWAEKTKGAEELAAWRRIQDANARVLLAKWDKREALYRGDRPPCPCGKVSYESKHEALDAARGRDDIPALRRRAYRCPLGHPVYHLTSSGRSTREDDRR